MKYDVIADFERLRNEWALKAPLPTKEAMDMEYRSDQWANPHNEPYANKRQRRSEGEIVADRSYHFADEILKRQYGRLYQQWLREHTNEVPHLSHVRTYR